MKRARAKRAPEEKVMSRALTPNILTAAGSRTPLEMGKPPARLGPHISVDFERRIDHDRLRRYRLSRTRQALQNSPAGTLLLFDVNNIRYVSATKIGEWERDKMCRFCLLTGDDSPMSGTSARRPCTTSAIRTG
jgi:Xaa-Pro aminopeptidase